MPIVHLINKYLENNRINWKGYTYLSPIKVPTHWSNPLVNYLGDDEPSDDSDPEGEESMDNDDVQLDHSLGYDCTRR